MIPQTVAWTSSDALRILDQTRLPAEEVYLELDRLEEVAEAIRMLRVRGAPAIGVAAAMGLVAALRSLRDGARDRFLTACTEARDCLAATRPTAVNLFWALDRMDRVARQTAGDAATIWERLRQEADTIWREDQAMCRQIGEAGAPLVPDGGAVLTHCNAGALATGGMGTALAPLYIAHERGRTVKVFTGETRPLGQGARLTAWELTRAGIDCTVVVDGVAATLLKRGMVDVVFVGADRIARNGDAANKIGTYGVAVLARHHGVPFYVLAPSSTIDASIASGDEIPIEERSADEVPHPAAAGVFNPAFDVTPAHLINGWVTEAGIVQPPFGP